MAKEEQSQEQGHEAQLSFFVKNEAASKAMARRKVIDRNNKEHEAVTISWSWRDTWQKEHKRAFVIAKMCKADLLTEVHDSLQKALDEGQPFEQWKKEIVPKLEGSWLGKSVGQLWDELSNEEKDKRVRKRLGEAWDSLTEDEKREKRASYLSEEQRQEVIAPKRLELIFHTNMSVANAAGHYHQLMKTKAMFPYWRYITEQDSRVRSEHRVLHNRVYRWDDPFWQTFFPPNGFRCRCRVRSLSKRDVERRGLHVEESTMTEDADGRKVLDVGGSYYRNSPGWDYNPGDSISNLVSLAKDNKKGRPAQIQAELEADLAKKEAEDAAAAKAKADTKEAAGAKDNNVSSKVTSGQAEEEEQRKAQEATQKAAEEAQERAKRIKEAHASYMHNSPETLRRSKEIHALSRSLEIHPYVSVTQDEINGLCTDLKAAEKLAKTSSNILSLDTSAKAKELADRISSLTGTEALTEDERNDLQKYTNQLKRLERIQTALNNRLARAATAVEKYPQYKADKIAIGILKDAGYNTEVAKNCSLEHAIAIQEKKRLDQEIAEMRRNSPSEAVAKQLDVLQKSSAELLEHLKKTADSAGLAAKDLQYNSMFYVMSNVDAVESGEQLASLHQRVTQLRLGTLSAADRKQEQERLQKRREHQQIIHISNNDIFVGLSDKLEAARKTKIMQREFDLMMYNFGDDELELYESYCRHHVAIRDPKNPNSNNNLIINDYLHEPSDRKSKYDRNKKKCYIRFNHPAGEGERIGDYLPRFNWNARFHEEVHHLDAIFGDDYLRDGVETFYPKLTHPSIGGQALHNAILGDVLKFVNGARQTAGYSPLQKINSRRSSNDSQTLDALLDRLVTEANSATFDYQLCDFIDIMGLFTHGVFDHVRIKKHISNREWDWDCRPKIKDPNNIARLNTWKSIKKTQIDGHNTDYNKRDLNAKKYPNLCDETSEALAILTAARWSGGRETSQYVADYSYLPNSCNECRNLIKRMATIMRGKGFVWPNNN